MEKREDLERLGRGLYAHLPEHVRDELLAALWDATEKVCEELGEEASPEIVAAALDMLMRGEAARSSALVSEFVTEEELEKVQREERERLGASGQDVDEAVLTAAMTAD